MERGGYRQMSGRPAVHHAAGSPREPDDEALLAAVAAGDRQAFSTLFLRYQDRLHRFLYRLSGSADLADELANDVMLVVWRQAGRYRGDARGSTWILGIAYRMGLKALRRVRRRRRLLTFVGAELFVHADPTTDPARELADLLEQGLARLSPEQRLVLELTYYLGLSCEEIGRVAGCPVNTVKTRLFHARRRLKHILPQLERLTPPPSTEDGP